MVLDRISLVITIIGAINWLLVGLFQFDLVAYICGGQAAVISRVVYTIVGIAGLWCISLLFRERVPDHRGDGIDGGADREVHQSVGMRRGARPRCGEGVPGEHVQELPGRTTLRARDHRSHSWFMGGSALTNGAS